jgi:molybdopterin molybdotransferase
MMAVSIDEALRLIYESSVKKSVEIVNIEDAKSRILAQDIVSTCNLPTYDNSAMDGFAIKCSDAGESVKVTQSILAGDKSDFLLVESEAIRIMTGAKIPSGSEAIVPIEDVIVEADDCIKLPQNIKAAQHIRLCGEDIKSGEVILKKYDSLDAYKIALLASQGITHVEVFAKVKVAILSTGSELKMHYESIDEYELYNTNTPSLEQRCKDLGCDVMVFKSTKDDLEEIKSIINEALRYDIVFTSGGVSVGDADYTKEAFEAYEYENIFEHIKIKPGKPTTFGKIKETFVLNLPGNPLACMMNFELFGTSLIMQLSQRADKYIEPLHVTNLEDIKIKKGRDTLVIGDFGFDGFKAYEKRAPGMLSPLAYSNSYAIISEARDSIKKDESIKVIPMRFLKSSTEQRELKN